MTRASGHFSYLTSTDNSLLIYILSLFFPQFERWQLTAAEREVALLLLKGLSHKEIAVLRDTSERTIRQQAQSIYGKSNLSGRAALSAFFLEDMLLPRT